MITQEPHRVRETISPTYYDKLSVEQANWVDSQVSTKLERERLAYAILRPWN